MLTKFYTSSIKKKRAQRATAYKISDRAFCKRRFVASWHPLHIFWGDAETLKMESSVSISDITAVTYGYEASASLRTLAGNPYPEWVCFSIHTQDQTIDFACDSYVQLKCWLLGLSALVFRSNGGGAMAEPLQERWLDARKKEMTAGSRSAAGAACFSPAAAVAMHKAFYPRGAPKDGLTILHA